VLLDTSAVAGALWLAGVALASVALASVALASVAADGVAMMSVATAASDTGAVTSALLHALGIRVPTIDAPGIAMMAPPPRRSSPPYGQGHFARLDSQLANVFPFGGPGRWTRLREAPAVA